MGVPLLECICWDHDRFGKDYLGEFDIALEDIFIDGQLNPEVGHVRIIGASALTLDTAQMVYPQIETEAGQEEGQHCLRRNPAAILSC